MSAPLWIALAWSLFGGSHLVLASAPLRPRLIARLGPLGFAMTYSSVATLSLCLLGYTQLRFGHLGPAGPDFSRFEKLQLLLGGLSFLATILIFAGLIDYPRSAMARMALTPGNHAHPRALPAPRGVFTLSRHPFFLGLAVLMLAHALLAAKLATALYFAGFSLLSLAGLLLQDRKLSNRTASPYPAYRAAAGLFTPRRFAARPGAQRLLIIPTALTLLLTLLHTPLLTALGSAGLAFAVALFGNAALAAQILRSKI